MDKETDINSSYTRFYADRVHSHVYPTEFVVRTFLGQLSRPTVSKTAIR